MNHAERIGLISLLRELDNKIIYRYAIILPSSGSF